jgi:hypothetical protein
MADRLPDGVRQAVYERDGNACVLCGHRARNIHHRQPAQKRDGNHTPWNLLSLCGSGTTGCHGWIESRREWAAYLGLLVPQHHDPKIWAMIYTSQGWQQLFNDGLIWGQPEQAGFAIASSVAAELRKLTRRST